MSLYAADGSYNVTIVSGSTLTGIYAADGSYNVIQSPGNTYVGAYHPCGALYVTVVETTPTYPAPYRAPDGSWNISALSASGGSGYFSGVSNVTAVSGTFTGGGGGGGDFYVAEDGVTFYVAEDGATFYIPESTSIGDNYVAEDGSTFYVAEDGTTFYIPD